MVTIKLLFILGLLIAVLVSTVTIVSITTMHSDTASINDRMGKKLTTTTLALGSYVLKRDIGRITTGATAVCRLYPQLLENVTDWDSFNRTTIMPFFLNQLQRSLTPQLSLGFSVTILFPTTPVTGGLFLAIVERNLDTDALFPLLFSPLNKNVSSIQLILPSNRQGQYKTPTGTMLSSLDTAGFLMGIGSANFLVEMYGAMSQVSVFAYLTASVTYTYPDGRSVGCGSGLLSASWNKELKERAQAALFVIDNRNRAVASSYAPELQRLAECSTKYNSDDRVVCLDFAIADHPIPIVKHMYLAASKAADENEIAVDEPLEIEVEYDGKKFFVAYKRTVANMSVLAFSPKEGSDFNQFLGVLIMNICVSFLMFFFVGFMLFFLVISPLQHVGTSMKAVSVLQFDEASSKKDFLLTEMHKLSLSFQRLSRSLDSFLSYVPREVVREMIAEGSAGSRQMVSKTLTLMFIDVANFTTLCESTDNDDLMAILDNYFTQTTRVLMSHGCTIDKFIGDAIMGIWGAPLDYKFQAYSACCAALNLLSSIKSLNVGLAEILDTPLSVRIGIHRGVAVVGNTGCAERVCYTALGDTVNIAAQLEAANKYFQTSIMVSATVISDSEMNFFVFRHLGSIFIKGRRQPLPVFQLIGVLHDAIPKQRRQRKGGDQNTISDYDTATTFSSVSGFSSGTGATGNTSKSHALLEKVAELDAVDELRCIRPPYRISQENAEMIEELSLTVSYWENMGFATAVSHLKPILELKKKQLEECGVSIEYLEKTLAQYQQLADVPPFSPEYFMSAHNI